MLVERDLLWRAWPEGYLARCGVRTVGGYVCIEGNEKVPDATFYEVKTGAIWPLAWQLSEDPEWSVIKDGALLPLRAFSGITVERMPSSSRHSRWLCSAS